MHAYLPNSEGRLTAVRSDGCRLKTKNMIEYLTVAFAILFSKTCGQTGKFILYIYRLKLASLCWKNKN